MSQLAALTGGDVRADLIPNYTLSRFNLRMRGLCEAEFARRHIRAATDAASGLPDALRKEVIAAALLDVSNGSFRWGRMGYDCAAHSSELLPFLLWVSLQKRHPSVTQEEAASLITEENELEVQLAVLEMMGYAPGKTATQSTVGRTSTGTGTQSSDTSGKSGSSPTSKSET